MPSIADMRESSRRIASLPSFVSRYWLPSSLIQPRRISRLSPPYSVPGPIANRPSLLAWAVLVLAVCGKLALDLLLQPSELYSLGAVGRG